MPVSAGDRLGPYVIDGRLGAGGMGEVYRARDSRLDRSVAIKILHADALADPEWRARFTQEAKAISALSHPNIVAIHDIGTERDTAYMVMELVEGQTLERLIPAHGMRLGDVLRVGAQIADACARAHAVGIIHRDLKPSNIMVPPDGRVRVLDFGIAKLNAPVTAAFGDTTTRATATAPGAVLGTAGYMSPEQAEGRPLDARSDIFSLGALLYEMTSGRRPFKGDSPMATMAAVLGSEPAPLGELRRDVPPELARLIMRCLRKDPARRVQSMADLKVALDELRADADSGRLMPAAPAAARFAGGRLVPALALLAVAALAAAGYFAWRAAHPAPPAEMPQPTPLTAYPGIEGQPSFSPDGTQLAFRWNGPVQDNFDIYVMSIGSTAEPIRLTTDPRGDTNPQWSPDGRSIAFLRVLALDRIALIVIPPLGGRERPVREFYSKESVGFAQVASLCWTRDSRYLLVTAAEHQGEPNRLLRVAVETGDTITLWAPAPDDTSRGFTSPSLSPDGRTVAMTHPDAARSVELLRLSDRYESLGPKPFPTMARVASVQWTTDGTGLLLTYFVNTPLPLYRMSAAGTDVTPLAWTGEGTGQYIAVNGTRLAFERVWRDTNIMRVDLASVRGGKPAIDRIAQSSFRDVAPQYSPDGTRLAYFSNRGGSIQVWTANADGSQPARLTGLDPKASTGSPRWSPDGKWISFDSSQGGVYHVYVVPSSGGRVRQLTYGAAGDYGSTWTLDGQWIYFGSLRSGRAEIWRIPAAGGTPEQVTTDGATVPMIYDRQWLYFTKRDGADGLWRIPLTGGEPTQLVKEVFRFNYAVTRDGIYYGVRDADPAVYYLDLATRTTTRIVPVEKQMDIGLAVSPDGKYLLFTQLDEVRQDLMLVENFR